MFRYPTSEDYNIALQKYKEVFIKCVLVDKNETVFFDITGVVIDGSMTIDASSVVRRTGNIDLLIKSVNKTESKIITDINGISSYIKTEMLLNIDTWLRNRIKLYIGVKSFKTGLIHWNYLGRFAVLNRQIKFDATNNTMSLSFGDLMTLLNGDLGGVDTGINHEIGRGENIRNILIKLLLQTKQLNKYNIQEAERDDMKVLPYPLTFSGELTFETVASKIKFLYPYWEFFVDDDTFYFQPIPTCESEPVVLNDDFMQQILLSDGGETSDTDLTQVKNVIEIWGNSDMYKVKVEETDGNGETLAGKFDLGKDEFGMDGFGKDSFWFKNTASKRMNLNTITSNDFCRAMVPYDGAEGHVNKSFKAYGTYYFRTDVSIPTNIQKINRVIIVDINTYWDSDYGGYVQDSNSFDFYSLPIVNQDGFAYTIDVNGKDKNKIIEMKLYENKLKIHKITNVQSLGENANNLSEIKQPYYVVKDDLQGSPYHVDRIGERRVVLSGGEYDNIFTERELMDRADYELWLHTRMEDRISLNTIMLPFLDVNKKIEYKPYHSSDVQQYIVQRISYNFNDYTMSMELTKFYDRNPFIVQKMFNYEKYSVRFEQQKRFENIFLYEEMPIGNSGSVNLQKVKLDENFRIIEILEQNTALTIVPQYNFGHNQAEHLWVKALDENRDYYFNQVEYNRITKNNKYFDVILDTTSKPILRYSYETRRGKVFDSVLESYILPRLNGAKTKDSYSISNYPDAEDVFVSKNYIVGNTVQDYYNLLNDFQQRSTPSTKVKHTKIQYMYDSVPVKDTFIENVIGKENMYPTNGELEGYWYVRKNQIYKR